MQSENLKSLPTRLAATDREAVVVGDKALGSWTRPVRPDTGVSLSVLDALMAAFEAKTSAGDWQNQPSVSDRWLALRVHYALRLTRAEASDKGVWQWLALRYAWYVEWRWGDGAKGVTEERWWGPIHKQAFARLWWGSEMFRNGHDYGPVEQAFVMQDLPNSYLHRPIIRCRSVALAIVNVVTKQDGNDKGVSVRINQLARVLNLVTVGSPPEVEVGYQNDDFHGYMAWVSTAAVIPYSWEPRPAGPEADDTTSKSLDAATAIVFRGLELTH